MPSKLIAIREGRGAFLSTRYRRFSRMYWAYHALGVSPGSSKEVIRKSYRRLLKSYHPDMLRHRGLTPEMMQRELSKFYEVQRAWELLQGEQPVG